MSKNYLDEDTKPEKVLMIIEKKEVCKDFQG